EARGIHGVRRIGDTNTRAVGKDALARLAVVRAPAAQVAADRHTDHHRARPMIPRAIPHHGHFVSELHHCRPDVIEELHFDHRLQATGGHADAPADDAGFGDGGVEDAILAVGAL